MILQKVVAILQILYLATKFYKTGQSTLEDIVPVIDYQLNASSNANDTAKSEYNRVCLKWSNVGGNYSTTTIVTLITAQAMSQHIFFSR